MPRHSLDRGSYYRNYYQLKKELIRIRYVEKRNFLNLMVVRRITTNVV